MRPGTGWSHLLFYIGVSHLMVDSPHDRVWECTVTDAESRSDAKAASTCVVPRGQKASGRQSHSALAARIQRSRLASQWAFGRSWRILRLSDATGQKILRDVMRPNCLFCHPIRVIGLARGTAKCIALAEYKSGAAKCVRLLCEV